MRSNPRNGRLFGLALAFALFAGCGGGDVPDAGDETAAAPEASPPAEQPTPVAQGTAPEGAVAPAAAATDQPATPAGSEKPAPAVETAAAPAQDSTATPTEATPPSGTSNAKSETAEMLALGAAPGAPASSAPAATESKPGDAPGVAPAAPSASGLSEPAAPGEVAAGNPFGAAPGGMVAPGRQLGESGAAISPGGEGVLDAGGGGSNDKGDVTDPIGAVQAFLYAAKTKDRERLAEATALRAQTQEEGGKYRELFSKINDRSISDEELKDLHEKFDGFTVGGVNQVKSTGRLGVTIRKMEKDGGWEQRTVTVRREKKGWGVLDLSILTKFNAMRMPTNRGRR